MSSENKLDLDDIQKHVEQRVRVRKDLERMAREGVREGEMPDKDIDTLTFMKYGPEDKRCCYYYIRQAMDQCLRREANNIIVEAADLCRQDLRETSQFLIGKDDHPSDNADNEDTHEYERKLQEAVRDTMKVWAGVNPDTQSWDTPIRATDANLMNWLQRLGSRCVKFYSDMYTGTIANQINVDVDRQAQRFVGSLFKPKDDDPETYKVTGTNVLVLPCALETLMLAFGRELKKLMDDDA